MRTPLLLNVAFVALLAASLPAAHEQQERSFGTWLSEFRAEALAAGIRTEIVDTALDGLEPLPVVLERDRAQAEAVFSLDRYLARRLDRRTLRTARDLLGRHASLLARVQTTYGVPPRVLVAVWGLESNFGKFVGVRPALAAIATLAFDDRRSAYFRAELLDALRILERGDIALAEMKGSWAGAMGQVQFMPSSYLKYAVDFDGDGRRDIWSSPADVFASIANYLSARGWRPGERWGREVRAPRRGAAALASAAPLRSEGCAAIRQMTEARPLAEWQRLNVRDTNGRPLPNADLSASLYQSGTRTFLLYPNYEAILAYNCAHSYALSVALLSDRLR